MKEARAIVGASPAGKKGNANCTEAENESTPLMEEGSAGGTCDVDMETALLLAANRGDDTWVKLLIARGADIERPDEEGLTPLFVATYHGHFNVIETLLDAGADIEAQSVPTNDTALSLACYLGHKAIVQLLIERRANKEHRTISGYTPISSAALSGDVEMLMLLLNAGAEANMSPLMHTAIIGHAPATKLLLARGADTNARIERSGDTALSLACFHGHTEVVRVLLAYNAKFEHITKEGLTPLMEAANGGYVDIGDMLLGAGAHPNKSVPLSRDTALTIASGSGHHNFVEMLIFRRAKIDARNRKGNTALWLACQGGHVKTVQTLVKYGAEVDATDNSGVLPLIIAFRRGHIKVVKYLVRHVQVIPDEEEYRHFLATVTDKELLNECKRCMEVIKLARNKRIAAADRAAKSLFLLLDKEEEKAKSQQLSKLRKNEKKKAKRQAKRAEKKENAKSVEEESVLANDEDLSLEYGDRGNDKTTDHTEDESFKPTANTGGNKSSNLTVRASTCGRLSAKDNTSETNISAWRHVDAGKRRSSRLSVSSNLIARVIGRAGENINSICEATGAFIKVDKQSGKKKQHDRQITVKGSEAARRQAMDVINGLIVGTECTVNDVIRQVTAAGAGASSASPSLTEKLATVRSTVLTVSAPASNPAPVTTTIKKSTSTAVKPKSVIINEASKAASNENDSLESVLSMLNLSVRPQNQQSKQHQSMGNPRLDRKNTDYVSGAATAYHTNEARNALNTSIPPSSLFGVQSRPPPSTTHNVALLADNSALFGNGGWPVCDSSVDATLLSQAFNQWTNYNWP